MPQLRNLPKPAVNPDFHWDKPFSDLHARFSTSWPRLALHAVLRQLTCFDIHIAHLGYPYTIWGHTVRFWFSEGPVAPVMKSERQFLLQVCVACTMQALVALIVPCNWYSNRESRMAVELVQQNFSLQVSANWVTKDF